MNIKIKKASSEDIELIQKLNHKIMVNNEKYDPCIIINFDLTNIGKEFFKESLEDENGIFLIAYDGEKPIGYINGSPKPYVYRKKKFLEIENIGVIPEYKRKGIGSKLYNALLKEIKKRGFERIYLNCYSQNKEALNFYKQLGFEEIDISLEKNI